MTLTNGVRVIVNAPPPPEPPPEPEPEPEPPGPVYPQAIILPPNPSPEDVERFATCLCETHRAFALRVLLSRGDVLAESANDLAQNVILKLWSYVREKKQGPENVRGFLLDLIDKAVVDNKRWKGRQPPLDREADPEAAFNPAPDQEERLDDIQHMEKLQRCMEKLPPKEREAVRYVELLEQTLETAAKALKRPVSTFAEQKDRGMKKLKALANADEEPEEPPPAVRPADLARRRG
jgi:RNA polymerase sigma factor (sigma-70 family)